MEPRSLYELFEQVTTADPEVTAFLYKRDRRWHEVSWSQQRETVRRISRSLLALGVDKGDRVSILGQSRLEWLQIDTAVVSIGTVTVGIYHSSLAPECRYILEHSGSRILFVEDVAQLEKVRLVRDSLPQLQQIVIFDGPGDAASGVLGWEEFLELGAQVPDASLDEIGAALGPGDLATLVYTSGTTGVPKGAMISHGNLLFTAWAASHVLKVEPQYVTLLFLPLAHVFARMIAYLCQRCGATVAFAEDPTKIAVNIREVRPHFLCSVPRIYEKIHSKITTTASDAGGLKEKLFDWAVGVGNELSRRQRECQPVPPWTRVQHALADRLVLRKIQAAFGGRLVWAASGAAPLNQSITEFFLACGVPIIEGLGMTENTSLSNANRLDHNKPGTVGPVVPGVEMKLAEDGEILFRGDNVMEGYFKDPEATEETIDSEGWLHSGDIGEIDEDGFLKITDRKKDLIITAGGKNVAPQRIERILRTSRYISQAVACGDRKKYLTALITLDLENMGQWTSANGLNGMGLEEMARDSRVRGLIEQEIAERNGQLASFETVKKFRILPSDLSIEGGELTPTLKIKRRVVAEKYRALLEELYRD